MMRIPFNKKNTLFLFGFLTIAALFFYFQIISTRDIHSQPTTVVLSNIDYVYGSSTSPLMVVEYYDLECPYCKALHDKLLTREYLLHDIQYVYRPFPLSTHKGAAAKNVSLLCAAEQDKNLFLEGMKYVYRNLDVSVANYNLYLKSLVKDKGLFDQCSEGEKYETSINDSVSSSRILGVHSTPSLAFVREGKLIQLFNYVGANQGINLLKYFLAP